MTDLNGIICSKVLVILPDRFILPVCGIAFTRVCRFIGENFAERLQFEDLAVKNFFLFYYVHIFVKNLELVSNVFF